MNILIKVIFLATFIFFAACSPRSNSLDLNTTETSALTGTALGAGLGAIIGSQSGNAGPGTAIGAAAGALGGALVGGAIQNNNSDYDSQEERLRRQEEELRRQRREIEELRRGYPGDDFSRKPSNYDRYNDRYYDDRDYNPNKY